MLNFDMDFDKAVRKESRLAKQRSEQERREKHERHVRNKNISKTKTSGGSSSNIKQANTEQPETTYELEHTPERNDIRDEREVINRTSSSSSKSDIKPDSSEGMSKPKVSNLQKDVSQFKEVDHLFDYVGGSKHITLNENYKKVQVTGIPEALITYHQNRLKDKYVGRLITFPWGDYEITATNKVFTARTSYIRYNLFSGLRDIDATHVILAKQWLVLHHPMIYDEHYDLAMSYQVHNDELDIYAIIYAEYLDEMETNHGMNQTATNDTHNEMMNALYVGLSTLRKMLQEQQNQIQNYTEQTNTIQTVLLLDRLGLLGGGLPSDMRDFIRVLELNRDNIYEANISMHNHIQAEKERLERIRRDQQLRNKNR